MIDLFDKVAENRSLSLRRWHLETVKVVKTLDPSVLQNSVLAGGVNSLFCDQMLPDRELRTVD
jgi:hypothetical protein